MQRKRYCIDNIVTRSHRSLLSSWRSGGAFSGTSSNLNISEYPSSQATTTTRIMATSSGILKDCTHITFNDTIKTHNNVTFKLVKTGKFTFEIVRYWKIHHL